MVRDGKAVMRFDPSWEVVATTRPIYPASDLLVQTGMFGADLDFAYRHATPALTAILDSIPSSYHEQASARGMELNIDARVHELKEGDYPATPGGHCDAPAREQEFSESSPLTPVASSIGVNVSSHPLGVSNTIFATRPIEVDDDTMTQRTWDLMDAALGDTEDVHLTQDGQLLTFSCYTPHRVQAAQRDGVRLFVRISQWVKPAGFTPGLSRIEQVYRIHPKV